MKVLKSLVLIGIAMLVVGAFAAAGTTPLVIGISTTARTLDPHGAGDDGTMQVFANIFDALVEPVDNTGELAPALATSWERLDALTWRIVLRQGVVFSNGNPFNADDVLFSLDRIKDPVVSEFLSPAAQIAEVRKLDDYTVEIVTSWPIAWFDINLHMLYMMDKESTENRSASDIRVNPIGTGAFKLVDWQEGTSVEMEANPTYWGDAPYWSDLTFVVLVDPSTRVAALLTDEVDIIEFVPPELYDQVQGSTSASIVSQPGRRAMFLYLANEPGFAGEDLRVRMAIAKSINVEEIISTLLGGRGTVAAQFMDVATYGYNPDLKPIAYDPEGARLLLAEAGYANGFDLLLQAPNDRYLMDAQIGEAIVRYMLQVGINAELEARPKAIHFDEITTQSLENCGLLGWFGNAQSDNLNELLHTFDAERGAGVWNGVRYSDPTVDALIELSGSIVDTADSLAVNLFTNKFVTEKLAFIPLFYYMDSWGVMNGKGIEFVTPANGWMLAKYIGHSN